MSGSTDTEFKLKTVDHLFRIQELLSENSQSTNQTSNGRLAAYLRWTIKNKLENEIEQPVKSKNSTRKLSDLNQPLCQHCWSVITDYRLVPKKLKDKSKKERLIKNKKRKSKKNSSNIFLGKCHNCDSRYKFNGLPARDKVQHSKSGLNPNTLIKNVSKQSSTVNKSINNSISKNSKTPSTNVNNNSSKTPTTSANRKEFLKKLLSDSKSKRNLDSKTKLSSFLSSCFNK